MPIPRSLEEKIERTLVRVTIAEMRKAGFVPVSVYDGGEYVPAKTRAAVLDAVFAVDTSTIHFAPVDALEAWGCLGVYVVCGNGTSCLSDWHMGDAKFGKAMQKVMQRIDSMEARA